MDLELEVWLLLERGIGLRGAIIPQAYSVFYCIMLAIQLSTSLGCLMIRGSRALNIIMGIGRPS